jgi:hypothetical protein
MSVQLGDFLLEKKIGAGGMGQVYLGRQISLDRRVAVKVMPKSMSANADALKRFEREAKSAANLIHPNVIQIYHFGVERGVPYFAMEYIEGEDLDRKLKAGAAFSMADSLDIIIGVAKALQAAFKQGIVHRDIKPANIMITEDGTVKVMDFGLAKAAQVQDQTITQAGMIIGTPHYMSPEQGKGEELDTRSDIYSLGVLFYQLLAGELPFKADTPTAMIYQHAYEKAPPIRNKNPEVPEDIASIVHKMLEKNSADRFQTPQELVDVLTNFKMGTLTPGAFSARITPASMNAQVTMPMGALEEKKRVWVPVVIALIAAVIPLSAIGYFFREDIFGTAEKTAAATGAEGPATIVMTTTGGQIVEKPVLPNPEANLYVLPLAELEKVLPAGTRVEMAEPDKVESVVVAKFKNILRQPGIYTFRFTKSGYMPFDERLNLKPAGLEPPFGEIQFSKRFSPLPELSGPYKEAETFYERAAGDFERGDFKAALAAYKDAKAKYEQVSQFDPLFLNTAERLKECSAKIKAIESEAEKDFTYYQQAKQLAESQKYAEALEALKEIPDSSTLAEQKAGMVSAINAKLALIGQNLADAETALRAGELDRMESFIQRVLAEQADNADARSLTDKRTVAKRLSIAGLAAYDRKDYYGAKKELGELLKLSPDWADAAVKYKEAEAWVEKEETRKARISELLSGAEADYNSGTLEGAIAKTTEILEKLETGHAAAAELKQKAEIALDRRNISALMKRLDAALQSSDASAVFKNFDQSSPEIAAFKQDYADMLKDAVSIKSAEHEFAEQEIAVNGTTATLKAAFKYAAYDAGLKENFAGAINRVISFEKRGTEWLITSIKDAD